MLDRKANTRLSELDSISKREILESFPRYKAGTITESRQLKKSLEFF